MATHQEIGNAFKEPEDGALFVRFLGACVAMAGAIKQESAPSAPVDPEDEGQVAAYDAALAVHNQRQAWAGVILSGDTAATYAKVHKLKNFALATNADVQYSPANVTDASINTAIQSGLTYFAGS